MEQAVNICAKSIITCKRIDLDLYQNNARIHDEDQIAAIAQSIEEFGWTIPVLIDENNVVLAGHGRLLAAEHLGISEVPCIRATGWSEAQKRAYRIADNKLVDNANWDMDILRSELTALDMVQDFDLTLTGFNLEELHQELQANDNRLGALTDIAAPSKSNAKQKTLSVKGINVSFSLSMAERDDVINWLNVERKNRDLTTNAAALVAIAREKAA